MHLAKKQQKDSRLDVIIKGRELPILTLDARWHELFPEDEKNTAIKELEHELNNLLKRQGKLINDIKKMKSTKKGLMKDIVVNMDIRSDILGKQKEKKLDINKRLISELNDKIKESTDELLDIPFRIKEVNEELMVESFKVCSARFKTNKKELTAIEKIIRGMRDELKVRILAKQDMETMNTRMYTYFHDILGADAMEALEKEFRKN